MQPEGMETKENNLLLPILVAALIFVLLIIVLLFMRKLKKAHGVWKRGEWWPRPATAGAALFGGAGEVGSLLSGDKTRLLQPPIKCPSPIDSSCDLLQRTVCRVPITEPRVMLQLTRGATRAKEIIILNISLG